VLPSWEQALAEDWLGAWAMNQMLLNVSTRKFRRSARRPQGDVPTPAATVEIGRFPAVRGAVGGTHEGVDGERSFRSRHPGDPEHHRNHDGHDPPRLPRCEALALARNGAVLTAAAMLEAKEGLSQAQGAQAARNAAHCPQDALREILNNSDLAQKSQGCISVLQQRPLRHFQQSRDIPLCKYPTALNLTIAKVQ
jgi:hypothetical protein